jgi:hypothetical protein
MKRGCVAGRLRDAIATVRSSSFVTFAGLTDPNVTNRRVGPPFCTLEFVTRPTATFSAATAIDSAQRLAAAHLTSLIEAVYAGISVTHTRQRRTNERTAAQDL